MQARFRTPGTPSLDQRFDTPRPDSCQHSIDHRTEGLLRTDNKRPDGFTLIPWQAGRNLTWDVSIVNTVAASYIQTTSVIAGGATEIASERKIVKYVELSNTSCFCPIIFETFGPINDLGLSFLDELGRRIAIAIGMQGKPHIYFSVFR